jgi:NTE family protein
MSDSPIPSGWLRPSTAEQGEDPAPGRLRPRRIGVVLSGGGLRGAGHIGVLHQLVSNGIPVQVIVGSSAGAIVGAYYAAVGLTLDELMDDAREFRGRHLLAHSLNIRLGGRLGPLLTTLSGVIPARLGELDRASFDRLHHGIEAFGVVCHDVVRRRPSYFATGRHRGVRVADVVRASASIPGLFPAIRVPSEDGDLQLCDGGLSDGLPVAFARQAPLSATHLIVSDCRWVPDHPLRDDDQTVYVRPQIAATGTLRAPSSTLVAAVREGAAAVTEEILRRLERWRGDVMPGTASPARG